MINKPIFGFPCLVRWLALTLTFLSVCLYTSVSYAAGLLTPNDGSPSLSLKEHHVAVVVENGFSVVEIDQTFSNPHNTDQQATYSFPIPKDAAVGEFTYWIDGKPVHAEVLERSAARNLHEQQRQQGMESALVEQNSHKSFEMEIAIVRSQSDVRVRLVYLQKIHIDHSMGRFVYPLAEGGVDPQALEFWSTDETVQEAFSFQLTLRSDYPVDAVRMTNSEGVITQISKNQWEINIDKKYGLGESVGPGMADAEINAVLAEAAIESPGSSYASSGRVGNGVHSLDKDLVVYWRLSQNLPGAVDLVTFKEPGSSTGTFMLTLTPGIDLAPITEGRDWVFVLDTSGSMKLKFSALLDGVERSLKALSPADRFKVVLFDNSARSLSSKVLSATPENINSTLRLLDAVGVGGGTNLYDGLKEGIKTIDQDRTTAMVLVTDGVANVGHTQMKRFLKLLENVDIRIFTAVMGNGANQPLLEGLTHFSEGFSFSVSDADDMMGLMMQIVGKVTHEALHDVEISIDGIRTRELTEHKYARVYRGEQLIVMGKYAGNGEARVTLSAEISGERKVYESRLLFADQSTVNPELERLWAFANIKALLHKQDLLGETEDTRQGITDLALGHGLVTPYTSLIATREVAFEAAGIDRENKKRIEKERQARQARAKGDVESHTQDSTNPMFPSKRSNHGGVSGGAGSVASLLLLALALLGGLRLSLSIYDNIVSKRRARRHQDME